MDQEKIQIVIKVYAHILPQYNNSLYLTSQTHSHAHSIHNTYLQSHTTVLKCWNIFIHQTAK